MVEEIAFESERISNFQGLETLTLDQITLHNVVHDFYLHAKFYWNGRNFLWTDGCTYVCTYGQMDIWDPFY